MNERQQAKEQILGMVGKARQVYISVGIPYDSYKEIKDKGWTHREVYLLGFMAKKENPQLQERMLEYEERIKQVVKKLEFYARKCNELDEELDNVKRGTGKC